MTKKSRQKFKYLEKRKELLRWNKKHFQGLPVAKNCLTHETAPLTILAIKRGPLCNFAKTLMWWYSKKTKFFIWNCFSFIFCHDNVKDYFWPGRYISQNLSVSQSHSLKYNLFPSANGFSTVWFFNFWPEIHSEKPQLWEKHS